MKKLFAPEAVMKYPKRNVLLVWPSMHGEWAGAAIEHMKKGKFLIYMGDNSICAAPLYDDGSWACDSYGYYRP